MKSYLVTISIAIFTVAACNQTSDEPDAAELEKRDSLSKVRQNRQADSLKKTNPLLILPPDSNYTGTYVDRYPNGVVKFTGFFRFGERHGQWMSFFPNGEIWSEMHYDKGVRQGPNIVYYENGKVRYNGQFMNDMQDSIWTYYDTLGKIARKVLFENNKIVRDL